MNENIMDYKKDLADRLAELKEIAGFPIGNDEDILSLSEPPYYTACPNPYIKEFVEKNAKPYDESTDSYHREPFLGDVSFGRNDPLLNTHFYHTKVPPKAIQEYIEHYTEKDDVVLDGFCGTGTTGIAASRTNRYAILADLSPIATFIAANQNIKISLQELALAVKEIESKVKINANELYTVNVNGKEKEINYTIWSDAFQCPFCKTEYYYFDKFVDFGKNEILENVKCSVCNAVIDQSNDNKLFKEQFDNVLNKRINFPVQKPVLISYFEGKSKKYKIANEDDVALVDKINDQKLSSWTPSNPIMFIGENFGDLWRAGYHKGYTHTHHFYTKRNLICLSFIYSEIQNYVNSEGVYQALMFIFTSLYSRSHRMNRYIPKHGRHVGPLSGTLYMSSLQVELNVINIFKDKAKSILTALSKLKSNTSFISTQSVTELTKTVPENIIDYIYTDPPFGDNLPYSELNFIMEDWIKLHTNNKTEAIINNKQLKSINEYNSLMNAAFREYFRVLKPNRWITVVFHNSQSKVWTSIQEAITKAGFIISRVSVLDKKKGTTKQLSYNGAVKNDLVISAFKPRKGFTTKFINNSGFGLELEFITMFLGNLSISPVLERTRQMLYSKLIAYYLQQNYEIRFDAKTFYSMLSNHFMEEDGFWFTSNEINQYIEYKRRMKLENIDEMKSGTLFLFVSDEKSALVWLFNFLAEPRSFSDVSVAFNQLANIQGDNVPELREMLEQNFIYENDSYRRPKSEPEYNQITEKREKILQKEFESLLIKSQTEKGKIKIVRKEALSYGFEMSYKAKRFNDILTIAKKLDKSILENSSELNDFVEAAEIMIEGIS